MSTYSNAKIIITGEHAVLHGTPALAIPVQLPLKVNLIKTIEKKSKVISITYLEKKQIIEFVDFKNCVKQILNKFYLYRQGLLDFSKVINNAIDFICLIIHLTCEFYCVRKQKQFRISLLQENVLNELFTCQINIDSKIPLNLGLGSSASLTISSIKNILKHIQKVFGEIKYSKEEFIQLAIQIENYQHGKSSGLDIISVYANRPVIKAYKSLNLINHLYSVIKDFAILDSISLDKFNRHLILINTGTVNQSSGTVIEHATKILQQNQNLMANFEQTCRKIIQELLKYNFQNINDKILNLININQMLLTSIGVVPSTINLFISNLQANFSADVNFAAKICGAGASCGDSAGVLLLLFKNEINTSIVKKCRNLSLQYGFKIISL